jgi:hypothetical protein
LCIKTSDPKIGASNVINNFFLISFSYIGSTTDLTPSVIGYYDRLSGSFNGDKLIGEVTTEKPLETLKSFTKEQSPKPKLIVSKIPTKPTAIATSINSNNKSLPKINSNLFSHQHHPSTKTLQIISPNVHRMISSHQTTTETITNSYVLSNNLSSHLSRNGSHNLQVNKRQIGSDKFTVNLPLSSQRRLFANKPTGIAIPLTKNLSKISQSLDSSEPIVHTITDNNCSNEEIYTKSSEIIVDSEKTPTNCDHNFNYDNLDYHDDDDDNIQNVLNKTSELINNLLSAGGNDNDKINNNTLDIHESTNSNNNDRVQPSIDEMSRHKYKLHVNSTETDEEDAAQAAETPLVEKLVTNLKTFAKSLDNVTEIDTKQQHQQQQQQHASPPTASPKLTYSRAKLLSNKNADATATSASDGKLASPSTKHRPLSAASISSSSSSTSTGSSSNSFGNEILTGANRQYLASIESLADHSENEVNHPSLTMCERAALEIVESEKSFVQDLGQIIKGYLKNIFINSYNV